MSLGANHAEASDRIRAAPGRHPDYSILRRNRILAQRVGLLESAASDRPHRADRRHFRQRFKAMHNLRTDRSSTNRLLNSDQPVDNEMDKYLRGLRGAEMPAMSSALEVLPSIEFAQQTTLVPELDRLFKILTGQQKEFWDQMNIPKASRKATLGKEYLETTAALLETLDKLSAPLAAAVNHQDATIDQLLAIKQIAWLLRNTGGEASLIVSTALGVNKVAPETRVAFTKYNGGAEAAWNALELTASGMQLPPAISSAMAATKTAYFEPQ